MTTRNCARLHPKSIRSLISTLMAWTLMVVASSLFVQGHPPPKPSDNRDAAELRLPRPPFREIRGAVYAMTNEADGNRIAVYYRYADGTLSLAGYVATGGRGSGGQAPLEPEDALGSQNPLILSKDGRWLFAVNAGSDEISVFEVTDRSLRLADRVPSGGPFPASLTFDGEVLYVLNAGGDGRVAGFRMDDEGRLTAIEGSTRSLNQRGINPPFFLVSPAQIGFSPLGDFLVVTVKGSDKVYSYSVDRNGMIADAPMINPSYGKTPFGFVFDRRGNLIVVEPFGQGILGQAKVSAVSSYRLSSNGEMELISGSVDNLQTATCWIAILPNGRYAYATNNVSNTITGYRVNRQGELVLLHPDGMTAETGHAPVDIAVTPDSRFVYAVNAGDGTVSMYAVKAGDGSLVSLGEVGGLPAEDGAVGVAAR